jgi:hypothetical protein
MVPNYFMRMPMVIISVGSEVLTAVVLNVAISFEIVLCSPYESTFRRKVSAPSSGSADYTDYIPEDNNIHDNFFLNYCCVA